MKIITAGEPIEIKGIYEEHTYAGLEARPVLRIITARPLTDDQVADLCSGAVTVEIDSGELREYPRYENVTECLYTFTRPTDAESELSRLRAELEALKAANAPTDGGTS